MTKPNNKPQPRYTGSYWKTCRFCAYSGLSCVNSVNLGTYSGFCQLLKRTIKNMDCTRCSAWKEMVNNE